MQNERELHANRLGAQTREHPFLPAHTHISGNDAFEVLNREDYHDTHTHTHVHNIWAHIMSLLLRSWPFCDIWKGQKEHHSRTHTHTHTHIHAQL